MKLHPIYGAGLHVAVVLLVGALAFLLLLGPDAVPSWSAPGTLRYESHRVENLRRSGPDATGLESLANGMRDGSVYGWLTDHEGNMIVRMNEVANGDIALLQVALPGHATTWSFTRSRGGGPWSLGIWDTGMNDAAKSHSPVLDGYTLFKDMNADGMPEMRASRVGVAEPPVRARLVDEPWVIVNDGG